LKRGESGRRACTSHSEDAEEMWACDDELGKGKGRSHPNQSTPIPDQLEKSRC
jgi:hypothetical protein